ncbi:uncharacterized protein LOC130666778 [Microplitis mediator]|uniref:uncharacterized protein LOC130666778 n=1 Tax=Microplitis mediator TaxID=375433 RepID=UPI00255558BD|nr:uncharacterized protein LOC130666778 [Microplitis mediator]
MIRLTLYCILIAYVVSVNCQSLSESHPSQRTEDEEVPLWEKNDGDSLAALLHKLVSCELEKSDEESVQLRTTLEVLYAARLRVHNVDSLISEHLETIRKYRKMTCSESV